MKTRKSHSNLSERNFNELAKLRREVRKLETVEEKSTLHNLCEKELQDLTFDEWCNLMGEEPKD